MGTACEVLRRLLGPQYPQVTSGTFLPIFSPFQVSLFLKMNEIGLANIYGLYLATALSPAKMHLDVSGLAVRNRKMVVSVALRTGGVVIPEFKSSHPPRTHIIVDDIDEPHDAGIVFSAFFRWRAVFVDMSWVSIADQAKFRNGPFPLKFLTFRFVKLIPF